VSAPTQIEAQRTAERIAKRLAAGEDMAALAREHDGDPGGKERAGDLGWVHRYAPEQLSALKDAFLLRVGETAGPLPTPYGYLILRREK
jgi:peptidyl-prolyl cis-trans isomerase D